MGQKQRISFIIAALTIMIFPIFAEKGLVTSQFNVSCQCINYFNEYMHCDCCKPDVSNDTVYNIEYKVHSFIRPQRSMKTCLKEWSTDPTIRCDCLFCGRILDKSHPKYGVCMDMVEDKPFGATVKYSFNVTVVQDGKTFNSNFQVDAKKVLKPAPVKFGTPETFVADDNTVWLKMKWEPILDVSQNLKYQITYAEQGDNHAEKITETKENQIDLANVKPNSVYEVKVRCRTLQGIYFSDVASASMRTAEKCFENAPKLVNFIADDSKCVGSVIPCVTVTVFWQHMPAELQWANCTNYLLEVSGGFGTFTQVANCTDVMAELDRSLPEGQTYNVSLSINSSVCVSPASYLSIPTARQLLEQKKDLLDTKVVRVKQNASIIVSIPSQSRQDPPEKFGLFYCKEGRDAKCERDVTQELVRSQREATVYILRDHGPGYLYNVASYWGDDTPGLSAQWICPYDLCGELIEPQISTTFASDSLTLEVTEFTSKECSAVASRGLPNRYAIRIQSPKGETKFLEKLHGPGPHRVTVSDLKPNTTYKVNVESHGECRTQQSSTAVVTTALENQDNRMLLVVVVVSAVMAPSLVILALVVCFYRSWQKKKKMKKELEGGTGQSVKALSIATTSTNGYYTKNWIERKNEIFGDEVAEYGVAELDSQVLEVPDEGMEGQTGNLNQAKQDSAVVSPFMSDQSAVALTTTTDLELDDLSSKQMRRPDPGFDQESTNHNLKNDALSLRGEKISPYIVPESSTGGEDDSESTSIQSTTNSSNIPTSSKGSIEPLVPSHRFILNSRVEHDNLDVNGSALPSYASCSNNGHNHKHSDYHQLPPVLNSASDDILTDSSCQSEDDEDTNGSASPFVKKLPLIGVAPNNIIV